MKEIRLKRLLNLELRQIKKIRKCDTSRVKRVMKKRELSMPKIEKIIKDYFCISYDIHIPSRKPEYVYYRQLCMYIMDRVGNFKPKEIELFFQKKHPVLIHSKKVIENYIYTDINKKNDINMLLKFFDNE